jgi:hypothetical protein
MVALRVQRSPAEFAPAPDGKAVVRRLDVRADATQAVDDGRDPV